MEEEQNVDLASDYDACQPLSRRQKSLDRTSEQGEITPDDLLHDMIKLSTGSETESEDSEYFSAEESVSVSNSDFGDGTFPLSDDSSDSETATDSECGSSSGACGDSKSLVSSPVNTRYKAPSNKQIRKRRQYYNGNEPIFPFSELDPLDLDFQGLREEVKLQEDIVKVTKYVPSLVDLCIIASHKMGVNVISQSLPPSMKNVMQPTVSKIKLKKIQMSWIFRLLSIYEPKKVYEERHSNLDNFWNDIKLKHLIAASNMFGSIVNIRYEGECEWLFNGSSSGYSPPGVKPDYSYSKNELYYLYNRSQQVLSVVASMINLMFPPAIHNGKKPRRTSKHTDEAELLEKEKKILINNIRYSLKKRFPGATELLFDIALAYIFWARGDVSKAAEMFVSFAEKESRGLFCEMYLYRIGHMYVQFHEMEMAAMFFEHAADAALHKAKWQNKEINDEIDLLKAMLLADILDQGVMTPHSTQRAASSWQLVLNMAVCRKLKNIGVFAVDSMLCFHGYCDKDDIKAWLSDIIKRMSDMTEQHPFVYLFLSMAHAWNGDGKHSVEAYRNFLHTEVTFEFNETPGYSFKSNAQNYTPWDKLVWTVQTVGTPKPLNVIWRTRLLPPKFVDKCKQPDGDYMEADLCSRELNLHMNSEGYITGDMQLKLPPVYKVQLDPYTGVLCPPNIPGDIETWKSFKCYKNSAYQWNIAPVCTPLEVYRDRMGNKVHLIGPTTCMSGLVSSTSMKTSEKSTTQILTWTGADWKKAKFSLRTKALEAMYKSVKAQIEYKYREMTDPYSVKMKTLCLELLSRCYTKGWVMVENEITKCIKKSIGMTHQFRYTRGTHHGARARSIKNKPKKLNCMDKFKGQHFEISFDKPVVFSRSRLLIRVYYELKYRIISFLMFVDCSSREAFMQPNVRCIWWSKLKPALPPPDLFPGRMMPQLSRSQYEDLVCLSGGNKNCYKFVDCLGEEFDQVFKSSQMLHEDRYCHRPYIIQNFVLYINTSNSLCSSCNSTIKTADFLGKVYRIDVCANVVITATEKGVKFLDGTCLTQMTYNITKVQQPSLDNLLVDEEYCFHLAVIGTKDLEMDTSISYKLTAIAYENHLILAEIPSGDEPKHHEIPVTLCIEVLGHAREICFLNQSAGFLLSVTQHTKSTKFYREHIYHYSSHGDILGILPCLGPGPRSFCPIKLPIKPKSEDSRDKEMRWHVYMRDGHGAIICCRLHC